MISAPRLPTRGMYSFSYQSMSTWSTARSPLTFALNRSGNIVGEWLPHTTRSCDVLDPDAELLGELRDRAVLVQPRHRGEALGAGCRARCCSAISAFVLAGLPTTSTAHVVGGAGVERLALRLEDLPVGLEQVGALHALRARPRAHQQRDVHAVEGLARVVEDLGRGEQREGAVLQLQRGALGGLDGVGDLEQAQVDLLVGAEHLAAGDAEQQRVADLAGGAGDGDGGGHQAFISSITASANSLVPTAEGSSRVGLRS